MALWILLSLYHIIHKYTVVNVMIMYIYKSDFNNMKAFYHQQKQGNLPIFSVQQSTPSYLSELLHLYSPSHSLCSSSDTCMLKIQRFNAKPMAFALSHTLAPTSGTISPKTSGYSLFLQKPTQDISLLRIFQLNHIVLHSYQSVQCVCVCVCVCVLSLIHIWRCRR